MAPTWKQLTPLPAARYLCAASHFKNDVYVAGGASPAATPTTFPTTVLRARANSPDGELGSWVQVGPALGGGKQGCSLVADANRMYVVGGWGGAPTGAGQAEARKIYLGELDGDGNVASWSVAGGLPKPLMEMACLVFDRYLYLFGGNEVRIALAFKTQTANQTALNFKTQTANFTVGDVVTGGTSGATGTIASQTDVGTTGVLILTGVTGTFQNNEALTDAHTGAAVADGTQYTIAHNFTVGDVVTGGTSAATGTLVSQTDAGSTGSLILSGVTGTFVDGEALTDAHTGAALADGTQTISKSAQSAIYRARISEGPIEAWAQVGSLPSALALRNGAVLRGDRVHFYEAGTRYWARLQRTRDGELLPWRSEATGFTRSLHGFASVGDCLVVAGGYDSGGPTEFSDVRTLKVDSEGNATAPWHATEPMLTAKDGFGFAVAGAGRMYAVGGATVTPTAQTEVQAARLNSAGQVGGA